VNALIRTIEVMGIIAFALTGIYEARKKGMDIIGVYAVAMITAFGGGSLRDVILDRHPLFWIEHHGYAVVLFGLSVVTVLAVRNFFAINRFTRAVVVLDALGLGLFSASGASVASQVGSHWFISALLGVTTGVFGGVMRDIICNEIPHVFTRTELYATCAFAGACSYLLILRTSGSEIAAVAACIGVTFALRMVAVRYDIRLPL
jgi:uncharacterized membrane protein YeiH